MSMFQGKREEGNAGLEAIMTAPPMSDEDHAATLRARVAARHVAEEANDARRRRLEGGLCDLWEVD